MPEDVAADTPAPLPKRDPRFDYDVLLVGGGQASVPLAPKLAGRGYRVGLAERRHLGGSCVNFGCLPSKAVHASARVAHQARRAADFGVSVDGVRADLPDVLARARAMINLVRTHIGDREEATGVSLLPAHARLAGRADDGEGFRVSLDAGGQVSSVTARVVVLDTGSRTIVPPIPGLVEADPITAKTWPTRDEMPRRLLVLGGGYIGVEMGQFYRRMGAAVTLVESGGQILAREDPEVAAAIQHRVADEGVDFRLSTKLERVEPGGDGLRCHLSDGTSPAVDAIFVAVGRRPNTDDLGLDTLGVATDEKGHVPTDAYGRTDVTGLWAVGDVRGGPAFTPTAHDDHHILLGRLLGERDPGGSASRKGRLVPYAVFTDPELGRVGLTERQARDGGLDFKVVRVSMQRNDRAYAVGEATGFVKLLVARDTGKVLGAAVVGPSAGELVHSFVVLMHLDRPLGDLHDAIFIHPTLSEIVHSAVVASEQSS